MSCFRELYALYPEKVMELCAEAAYDSGRLYCSLADKPPWNDECIMCARLSYDDGAPSWHALKQTCEGEQCRELWAWIMAPGKEGGNKRRQTLKRHFGNTSIWQIAKPMRREAILTAMLLVEANERKENKRLAA